MNVRTASNFGATAFAARSTQGSSYVRSMPIQIGLMNADWLRNYCLQWRYFQRALYRLERNLNRSLPIDDSAVAKLAIIIPACCPERAIGL